MALSAPFTLPSVIGVFSSAITAKVCTKAGVYLHVNHKRVCLRHQTSRGSPDLTTHSFIYSIIFLIPCLILKLMRRLEISPKTCCYSGEKLYLWRVSGAVHFGVMDSSHISSFTSESGSQLATQLCQKKFADGIMYWDILCDPAGFMNIDSSTQCLPSVCCKCTSLCCS